MLAGVGVSARIVPDHIWHWAGKFVSRYGNSEEVACNKGVIRVGRREKEKERERKRGLRAGWGRGECASRSGQYLALGWEVCYV